MKTTDFFSCSISSSGGEVGVVVGAAAGFAAGAVVDCSCALGVCSCADKTGTHAPPWRLSRMGGVPKGRQFFRLADDASKVGLRLLDNASREPAIRIVSLVERNAGERVRAKWLVQWEGESSVIIFLTLLLRFARHAVVTSLDQAHIRLSCPPFICVKSKRQM